MAVNFNSTKHYSAGNKNIPNYNRNKSWWQKIVDFFKGFI
jgi:hypothetical protein